MAGGTTDTAATMAPMTLPRHLEPVPTPTPRERHGFDFTDALCRQTDPELFFPDKDNSAQADEAKSVCRRCPVITSCFGFAMKLNIEEGIFGGFTASERAKLKRIGAC